MLPSATPLPSVFHRATPRDGSELRLFEDRSRDNLAELRREIAANRGFLRTDLVVETILLSYFLEV